MGRFVPRVCVVSLFLLLTSVAAAESIQASLSPEQLMDAEHWKRARTLVQERLHADPADPRANYLMSRVKVAFGDPDAGLYPAERAAASEFKNSSYHAQLAQVYALLAQKVSVVKQVIYLRRFKKEIETTLQINRNNLDTLLVAMMFHWQAPSIVGGDRNKARAIAEQLVSVDPAWGYLAQARLLKDGDDYAKTERVLLKAVQVQPPLYTAYSSLASFYCSTVKPPRYDRAEKAAKDAILLDPGRAAGYGVLACAYAGEQRFPELESILATSERNVPDDLSPYYEAARALVAIGKDFPRAERYLRKYLSQEPEGRTPSHAQARKLLAQVTPFLRP